MNKNITERKSFFYGLAFGLVFISIVSMLVVDKRLSGFESSLNSDIENQVSVLRELAITTSKGASNTQAETLIGECSNDERVEFENLLSKLDSGLSINNLTKLNTLFGYCGHVFADRRMSMYFQMEREFNELEYLVTKKTIIKDNDDNSVDLEKWRKLLDSERNVSKIFQEMVDVQEQIIDTLLAGKTTNSEEVQALLKKAQEIKNALNVATEEASKNRSELNLT